MVTQCSFIGLIPIRECGHPNRGLACAINIRTGCRGLRAGSRRSGRRAFRRQFALARKTGEGRQLNQQSRNNSEHRLFNRHRLTARLQIRMQE